MNRKDIRQSVLILICIIITVLSVTLISNAVTTISSDITTAGNVGIGTTTPNWSLQIADNVSTFALTDTSADVDEKHWIFQSNRGNLFIGTSTDDLSATTSYFAINNAGVVKAQNMILVHPSQKSNLDVNAPLAALHIRTEAHTTPGIFTAWTPMDLSYPYSENLQMGEWDGETYKERMRISGSVPGRGGFVGIGVTNPSSLLHISTTTIDAAMTFTSGAGSWIMGMDYSDEGIFKISSSTELGTSDRLVINNSGNIGIGTTSPTNLLDVHSSATSTIEIDSSAASQGGCLKIKDVDGGGYTYCYVLDGNISCSTNSCE